MNGEPKIAATKIRSDALEQAECNFDGYERRYGFAVGSDRGLEAPALHGFDRFLIEAQTKALHNLNFDAASIGRDHGLQKNRALIFRFARFVGIAWPRAVEATRVADSAGAGPENSAARAAAFTWTHAAAFAAADSAAISVTDAGTRARAARISD